MTLLICPSVPVWVINNKYYFDRKFYDGFLSYCNNWQGTVRLVMEVADTKPPQFGLNLFDVKLFPAELIIISKNELLSADHMKGADVVLASGDNFNNLHISEICKNIETKCIYNIEYILETRFQIIAMNENNYWKKIKSFLWLLFMEIKRRKAFRLANGIQSNGMPAYNSYKKYNSNMIYYFDSRTTMDMIISEPDLENRLAYLDKKLPLRLAFSGRLITIKGADHLVDVARVLHDKGILFSFDIFGEGDIVPLLKMKIVKYNLEKNVFLRGNLDFANELVPYIKDNIDLFVCCHRQSDPSCSYLETYACGVPIIGYANKAHQGMLDKFDLGWSVPMNDVRGLAEKIAHLANNRKKIQIKSINSRQFAYNHTFEKTFYGRVKQCLNTLNGS